VIATNTCGILIGGDEVAALSGQTFETFDPSTGEVIAEVARGAEADVDRAVASAREAFETTWIDSTPRDRGTVLFKLAALLRERAEELAVFGSRNGGLTTKATLNDVEVAARYCEFYAGLVDKVGGETIPLGPDFVDYTIREPWGVCGIIAPFNSPYQLPARSVAPALAAGNAVVIKASEQAPLATVLFGQLLLECGLPRGVVNVVPGFGHEAGARLAGHPDVDKISFTGSPATAQRVLEAAAKELTPCTLELGGKSPQIVFADADLEEAARTIMGTIVWSAGQACSAGTRILTEKAVHADLAESLAEAAKAVRVGRAVEGPDMGPLITKRQQEAVLSAIDAGKSDARLIAGGGRPTDGELAGGYFVEATIFDDVDHGSPLAQDEIFGPVLAITEIRDTAQALEFANATEFGLIAGVWTRDISRAHHLASRIRAGQVYVNTYGVGGGVELPFGGYKKSGYGREKGVAGYLEYTQVKNVCIKVDREEIA
jgi:aldehyde dehydrogenase (NAD+)